MSQTLFCPICLYLAKPLRPHGHLLYHEGSFRQIQHPKYDLTPLQLSLMRGVAKSSFTLVNGLMRECAAVAPVMRLKSRNVSQ